MKVRNKLSVKYFYFINIWNVHRTYWFEGIQRKRDIANLVRQGWKLRALVWVSALKEKYNADIKT